MSSHYFAPPPPVLALLDIGSAHIRCGLAETRTGRVLGFGQVASSGVVSGDIANPEPATGAILRAIAEAERVAGAEAQAAVLAVQAGRIALVAATADVRLNPPVVTPADIARLRAAATRFAEQNNRIALHTQPAGFQLDSQRFGQAPIERFGRHLEADILLVTADASPLRRLMAAVEATGLPVAGLVPSPLASGYAVTTPTERHDGIAVVDIGAGTTSISIFQADQPVGIYTLALGGHQMTAFVAEALQIPLSQAERIKTTCVSDAVAHAAVRHAPMHALDSGSNSKLLQAGSRPAITEPNARANLFEVLAPRIDAMLRLIADRIDAHPFGVRGEGRVVLTGGASQLDGLPAYVAHILGRRVRVGRPVQSATPFKGADLPDMAVIAGLCRAVMDPTLGVRIAQQPSVAQTVGRRA